MRRVRPVPEAGASTAGAERWLRRVRHSLAGYGLTVAAGGVAERRMLVEREEALAELAALVASYPPVEAAAAVRVMLRERGLGRVADRADRELA